MAEEKRCNGGYSLVELIIAVAILAIVLIPILHAFMTSTSLDGRSKRLLRVTTAAQNVMEEIRGMSMEELLDPNSDAVTSGEMEVSGAAGNYVLTYPRRNISGFNYKVVATISADEYSSATGEALYNDMPLPEIYTMDTEKAGIYTLPLASAKSCAEYFRSQNSSFSTAEEAMEQMTRKITIDISNGGRSTDVIAEYLCSGAVQQEKKEIRNSETMEALYIFLEPKYKTAGISTETVVINNAEHVPITVYVVKQETSETTAEKESRYRIRFEVHETGRSKDWSGEGDYVPITALRTNLEEGQIASDSEYDGAASSMSFKKMVGLDSIDGGVVEDRLYKVEVKVYDKNGEELVKIDGTKEK